MMINHSTKIFLYEGGDRSKKIAIDVALSFPDDMAGQASTMDGVVKAVEKSIEILPILKMFVSGEIIKIPRITAVQLAIHAHQIIDDIQLELPTSINLDGKTIFKFGCGED